MARNFPPVSEPATRSGSNQLRGAAFELPRNAAIDAPNCFAVGKPKTPLRKNQLAMVKARSRYTAFSILYDGLS